MPLLHPCLIISWYLLCKVTLFTNYYSIAFLCFLWWIIRSNPGPLHPFDSEIDRTFYRHDRFRKRSSIHTHSSSSINYVRSTRIVNFNDSASNFSDISHSESLHYDIEIMANNNNKTLKELVALDVNFQTSCIQYPNVEV